MPRPVFQILSLLVSLVAFAAAFYAGFVWAPSFLRVLPISGAWIVGRQLALLLVCIAAFYSLVGGVSRVWSSRAWTVGVAAVLAFWLCSAMVRWAMHVADEGDPGLGWPLWRYLVWMSAWEAVAVPLAGLFAVMGWHLGDRYFRPKLRVASRG